MNWYYAKGNDRFGPVTLEGLVQAAMSGVLLPSDLVWSDGMPSWVAADAVPDLFSTQRPHPLLVRVGGTDYLRQFPDVDGKAIVVTSGAVLPQRCVKTNVPVSEADMVRKDFYWCNPLWLLLFFVSGLLVIIIYFAVRKKCTLTYGLHPSVRRKYQVRVLIKVALSVALFLAFLFSTTTNSGGLIVALLIAFFVSLIVAALGNSPIAVKNHVDGRFWMKGCSKEFLRELGGSQPLAT